MESSEHHGVVHGLVNIENNYWEFFPDMAGVGEHKIFYDNNTCVDSVLMFVYPTDLIQDTIVICSEAEQFILEELPFGGTWSGDGVTNSSTGTFDPALVSGQTVNISYTTPTSCESKMVVIVEEFIQATLAPIEEVYCFDDIEVDVLPLPDGGTLISPTGSNVFNPSMLGGGEYTFTYGFPDNSCSADTTISFTVTAPSSLSLAATDTILCYNTGTTLTALAISETVNPQIVYEWSDGLFPVSENVVSPETGQFYYVSINDGCGLPVTDSIYIEVLEPIQLDYIYGDTLCYGEPGGTLEIMISPEDSYSVFWGDTLGTTTLTNSAGSIHELTVVNTDYNCSVDDIILIPSYSPLAADFSVNPNDDCIPFESNPVEFIDLSQNAVNGMWNFGNGDSLVYDGNSPESVYDVAGIYEISLIVENEGGCVDSALQTICVSDPSVIFLPDIFSPNDDGFNDMLFVRGGGILDLELSVYNRWGDRVHNSKDIDQGWDGNYL